MAGGVPPWLQRVTSPFRQKEWSRELEDHPDAVLASYILNGIRNGFHIGFDRSKGCQSARSNMRSALDNAAVVTQYLKEEVGLGCVIGPISPGQVPASTQLSPIGVIPKSSQPGKWRLIVDLSSPHGRSVNDAIEPELCSLEYLRLDEVVGLIATSGRWTQLAKMDIASAYRMVPVHPDDRPLLAMQWAGQIYFDTRLPFGLRSAPKIFTAVADALQWVLLKQGVSWVAHYLDDYITMGPPEADTCAKNLDIMLATCTRLGVPTAPGKCEGPATSLGFELDTQAMFLATNTLFLQKQLLLTSKLSSISPVDPASTSQSET